MMFNTGDLILDAVILSIVAHTPEGTYGYKITQDVRSKMDVPESTFYPLLKQMQMDGYLEVYHKDLGGRSRRFYKITEAGLERLEFCQQNWTNYLQNASALLMSGTPATANADSLANVDTYSSPAPEAQPAMEAPVEEFAQPVPEAQPVMEAPVEEFVQPVPEAQPVMEAPVEEFVQPVPEAQPVMEAPVEEFVQPVPEAQPVMEAPVEEFVQPVPKAQPVMEAPVEEIVSQDFEQPQEEDVFHIAGSDISSDLDFSIGGDDDLVSSENGISDDGDLFVLDGFNKANAISIDTVNDDHTEQEYQPVMEAPVEEFVQPVPEVQPVMEAPVEEFVQPVPEAQPVMEAPVEEFVQPVPEAQPVMEAPVEEFVQPVPEAQPVMEAPVEEFVQPVPEAQPIMEAPAEELVQAVSDTSSETEALSDDYDDEEDFKAEMALGDVDEADLPESDMSDIQTVSELEDLLSQLKSFENVMNQQPPKPANNPVLSDDLPVVNNVIKETPVQTPVVNSKPQPVKFEESRNKDTDDSLNSLVDLLKNDDQPKKKSFFFRNKKAKPSAPSEFIAQPEDVASFKAQPVKEEPVKPVAPVAETKKINKVNLTEIRNPETDSAVNSLVDLLKDDDASSKPKRFRPWGNKQNQTTTRDFTNFSQSPDTTSASVQAAPTPVVPSPAPVPVEKTVAPVQNKSVAPTNAPEDLVSNPKIFAKKEQYSQQMKTQPTPSVQSVSSSKQQIHHVVEDGNSVDSLVELLKGDGAPQKSVSIFGKSNRTYKKVAPTTTVTTSNTSTVSAQDASIPKPSVSEPRVFKPTASKSFEAKAASPNARPVETTATITKSLDAKAISTKPSAAKPAEAKSVETKAIVTPKASTAPKTEETPAENSMDSFRARLLQANLISGENNK